MKLILVTDVERNPELPDGYGDIECSESEVLSGVSLAGVCVNYVHINDDGDMVLMCTEPVKHIKVPTSLETDVVEDGTQIYIVPYY